MAKTSTSRGRFSNAENKSQSIEESLGLTDSGLYVPASNTTVIKNMPTVKQALDALDVYVQSLATKNYVDGLDNTNDLAHETLSNKIVQQAVDIEDDTVDWSVANHFMLTLSGDTELFESNLPEHPEVREISMNIDGNFVLTLPPYWKALSATTYDGSKTNFFKVFCENDTAVAKKATITLDGTVGHLEIDAAGELSKYVTFSDSLEVSAQNFVTDYAADYLEKKIVLTSNGSVITMESELEGYDFTPPVTDEVSGTLDGVSNIIQINVEAMKLKESITLSGADGKVTIGAAGGLSFDVVFNDSLTQSALDFATAYASDYFAEGIVLTADEESIIMEAQTASTGFTAPTTTSIVGDLDGAVTNVQANVSAVAQVHRIIVTGTSGIAIVDDAGGLTKSLTFNSTLSQTVTDFYNNNVAGYLAENIVLTKENATAQVDIVTLTDAGGTANITGVGGFAKLVTYNDSLIQTASDFVSSFADDYLVQGIVVTSVDENIIFTANIAGTAFEHPTITNVTDDLAGTVDNSVANVTPKLIFTANTAGVAFTAPTITNDTEDITGTVDNPQPNVVAVAQSNSLEFTGTDGKATVATTGGLTKVISFTTSLANTASSFVSTYSADYLAQGVVLSVDGNSVVMTANTAGTAFDSPTITNTPWDLDGLVATVQLNVVAVKQSNDVTLSGSFGAIDISVAGGLTKRVTYNVADELGGTAGDFVTLHAVAYAAEGIAISSLNEVITFEAITAGAAFDAPVVTPVAGDLTGSAKVTVANVAPKVWYEIKQPVAYS